MLRTNPAKAEERLNVKVDVRKKLNIKFVYGVIEFPNYIVPPTNLTREYYKTKHEKNSGKRYRVLRSGSNKEVPLDNLPSLCAHRQATYQDNYEDFLKSSALASGSSVLQKNPVFFSRVDLVDPLTQQTLYFRNFAELSDYLENNKSLFNPETTPKENTSDDCQFQTTVNKSQNLSGNINTFWKVALSKPVLITACAIAAAAVVPHLYMKK